MNKPDIQTLDVDALMRQIRREITARKARAPSSDPKLPGMNRLEMGTRGDVDRERVTLTRLAESAPALAQKREYTVTDFLNYHDEDFLRNAYRALLRREPNDESAKRFLVRLRTGDLSKLEILGRIRFSAEGRADPVRVTGLMVPFALRTIRRIPVLGGALGIVQYIFRLPNIVRCHERLEAVVFQHQSGIRRDINAIEAEVEAALQSLQVLSSTLTDAVEDKVTALEGSVSASRESVASQLDSLSGRLVSKVDAQEVAMLEQRLRSENDAHGAHFTRQLETVEEQIASKVDAQEIALLEQRLRSVGDARDAHFSRQLETLEEKILIRVDGKDTELKALRSVVDGLEQWTAVQPPREQLIEEAAAAATDRIGRDLITLRADTGRIELDVGTVRADTVRIDAKLTVVDRHLLEYRQNILEQERRLAVLLEDASKRLTGSLDGNLKAAAREEADHVHDAFYASFEDAFRGTREDIKQRVEVYLPYVREAGAGTATEPILDIGCGRGEWLELLKDSGLVATGVDLNRINVGRCRERGLVVVEADALDYLGGLKTASMGAVTGIHVIEHIAFRQLISLFDEVRRVLKPGAIAIFETPNPENLVVGACNFWYDPTHQQPLPPEPMRFILDNRGFTRVEVLRLHPNTQRSPSAEASDELSAAIAERLYGPQDYALIGYKS